MDLSVPAQSVEGGLAGYKSPRYALAWHFRRSRDGWKRKYSHVKQDIKRIQNRTRDLSQSRQQWKEKVKRLEAENQDLQSQVAWLEARLSVEQEDPNKKKRRL